MPETVPHADAAPHAATHAPGAHHGPSPVARLMGILRAESRDLWVVFIYAVGVGLLSLAVPIATASLVNSIAFGTVLQPVVVLTFMVFVGLCFEGLLRTLQYQVVEVLQRRVFVQVAIDLARRLPRADARAFDRADGPELVNRFFDVLTVQKTLATLLLDGLAVILQAVIGTLLLAFYHPVLLAFDVVLVLGIAVILFPMGSGAVSSSIKESKAKYAMAAWLEELARFTGTFHGADAATFGVRRADALAQDYLAARDKHFRVVLRQHVGSVAFKALVSASLLGIGGWLVINRGLTIGQLAAAELVVAAVMAGMSKIGKQLESFYDLVTAVDKLGHLEDIPLERTSGGAVPVGSPRGASLALRGVTFAWSERAQLLERLDLTLDPGARVAVLGRNGAGKSTLADVIVGMRSPRSGAVLLEGIDLRELSLDSVRDAVAVVRNTELFDASVADNVAVGRAVVTPDRVRDALAALGLTESIGELSDGVNTWLTRSGAPLSDTQARLLMFARAIAGAPRLVVIDGALDALDTQTAREVMRSLTAPGVTWTLLVLTHRETIAALCDRAFALRAGALTPVDPRRLLTEV